MLFVQVIVPFHKNQMIQVIKGMMQMFLGKFYYLNVMRIADQIYFKQVHKDSLVMLLKCVTKNCILYKLKKQFFLELLGTPYITCFFNDKILLLSL